MTIKLILKRYRAECIVKEVPNAKIIAELEDDHVQVEFEIADEMGALQLFHAGVDAGVELTRQCRYEW
jgi:hypothetical protein